MRCLNCRSENPTGARFCNQCGAPFGKICPKCAVENARDARFCSQCGASLEPTRERHAESEPRERGLEGERRHLTVLFCDLVGSTEIAAQLDPEEWRQVIASYHRAAAEAITRFGGYVAQYLGDGVMAFFGYPEAHDNNAERAVQAGLELLDSIAKLGGRPRRLKLAARVGIDSGAVVVGAGVGKEADVFGEAPNIAARVQAAAESGTMLITDAVHRLVSGLFVVESRGAPALKGIERALQIYKVVRPSGVRGRLEAAAAVRGLIPFIGREDELRSLLNRWERACRGEGQVVAIIGEAGIGKSRLVQRFREVLAGAPHTWIEAGAGVFFQNTPFYPITEMLRQLLSGAAAPDQIAQLASRLSAAGLKPTEAIPLLAPLLELSLPPEYPLSALPPEQQRRRLLATMVEWIMGAARIQSLVVVIEDLHWVDPSTLELIQLLAEQGATAPLLLLYTARPEFRLPWPQRGHHMQLTLDRLNAREVRTMIGEVAAHKTLPDETVATVIERTRGVPLFVEELTRAVLESGDDKLSGSAIPVTLHDSLMARLDRLGSAKEAAQVGAVIGAEFSYDLLHAVHPIPEPDFQRALRILTDAELLYVRGIAPEATYQFKHALIRDVAYQALLKSRRKELHLVVARTLDKQFPALKEAHPEVLARHWTEAGEIDFAVIEWQRAGEWALERRAYHEAERHYREALFQLSALPESSQRDSREMTLTIALGRVLMALRGWSAKETVETYDRAKLLAERGGDNAPLAIFSSLYDAAISRGELPQALALAHQVLATARGLKTQASMVTAYFDQGIAHHFLGNLVEARRCFLEAIRAYREADFRGLTDNPGITSWSYAGLNESNLGYPERALRYADEAVVLARRLDNLYEMAYTLGFRSIIRSGCGVLREAIVDSDEAVAISTKSGFGAMLAYGKIYGAWARALSGDAGRAVALIGEGLAELDSLKIYVGRPRFLCMLGVIQARSGAIDDALETTELGLETNPDDLLSRPILLHLRAVLRLRYRTNREMAFEIAQQDLTEAIGIARKLEAKSFELSATTTLARLLAKGGRRDEARTMLSEIYGWFTEGFDTADLKEAKALLEKLSG
jgi:class 3 adenylate cyclase/tetratricopeptide (TPR) repeat protein